MKVFRRYLGVLLSVLSICASCTSNIYAASNFPPLPLERLQEVLTPLYEGHISDYNLFDTSGNLIAESFFIATQGLLLKMTGMPYSNIMCIMFQYWNI